MHGCVFFTHIPALIPMAATQGFRQDGSVAYGLGKPGGASATSLKSSL